MAELVDPKNFKTYEELKAKLDMVLGSKKPAPTAEAISQADNNIDAEDEHFMEKVKTVQSAPVASPVTTEDEDEDDTLSYFKSLAEDS